MAVTAAPSVRTTTQLKAHSLATLLLGPMLGPALRRLALFSKIISVRRASGGEGGGGEEEGEGEEDGALPHEARPPPEISLREIFLRGAACPAPTPQGGGAFENRRHRRSGRMGVCVHSSNSPVLHDVDGVAFAPSPDSNAHSRVADALSRKGRGQSHGQKWKRSRGSAAFRSRVA
jgi:hypothetical protein